MAEIKPISNTLLDVFLQCPRKYKAKYIDKNYYEPETQALKEGKAVHETLEAFGAKSVPIPQEMIDKYPYMQKAADFISHFKNQPEVYDVYFEEPLGLDKNWKPLPKTARYWSKWLFGMADMIIVNKLTGLVVVVDWKTGKVADGIQQATIMALCTKYRFQAPVIKTIWFYLKHEQHTVHTFVDQSPTETKHVENLLASIGQYEAACRADTFPPQETGLCKNYCHHPTCEFNGRNNGKFDLKE